MLQEVLLPQLGQTMEEGKVEKWHKAEGDTVKRGEVLFEITTDKATLEVESFVEGVVKKILVAEGETVPVNEVVAIVGDLEDELPEDFSALSKKAGEQAAVAGAVEGGAAVRGVEEALSPKDGRAGDEGQRRQVPRTVAGRG